MFDGKTFRNWRDPLKKTPAGDSWVIQDGALKTVLKPRIAEDLFSTEEYRDFEFKFDWRLAPGGNSGVKYRIQKILFFDPAKAQKGEGGFEGQVAREVSNPQSVRSKLAPGAKASEFAIGFEFQLFDDSKTKDAHYQTGALYGMIAPSAKNAHPLGEWNESRLVVKGDHIEHWVNGVKVLDGSLASEEVRAGATKRWGKFPVICEMFTKPKPASTICLQHHGTEVAFRNLKLRRL
jgi:hypothetical protein